MAPHPRLLAQPVRPSLQILEQEIRRIAENPGKVLKTVALTQLAGIEYQHA